MKKIINFFKARTGKVILFLLLIASMVVFRQFGAFPLLVFEIGIAIIFFAFVFFKVYPDRKQLWFYNHRGRFEVYDPVYDRGSATRPAEAGILKNDGEGWFVLYTDGFEWPLSDIKNVEMFIYKPNN